LGIGQNRRNKFESETQVVMNCGGRWREMGKWIQKIEGENPKRIWRKDRIRKKNRRYIVERN
jgi:hypothetical protein